MRAGPCQLLYHDEGASFLPLFGPDAVLPARLCQSQLGRRDESIPSDADRHGPYTANGGVSVGGVVGAGNMCVEGEGM